MRESGRRTTSSAARRSRSTSRRTARSSRAASRSGSRPSSTRATARPTARPRSAPRAAAGTEERRAVEGLGAQGLLRRVKKRKVGDSVSLDIQRGEVVGLLGPNGAGKTTSFYMMVGLLAAEGGRIFLEGEEITGLPMYQRCRLGVGYLPQESSVFRKLTVEENLLAILETLDLSGAEGGAWPPRAPPSPPRPKRGASRSPSPTAPTSSTPAGSSCPGRPARSR